MLYFHKCVLLPRGEVVLITTTQERPMDDRVLDSGATPGVPECGDVSSTSSVSYCRNEGSQTTQLAFVLASRRKEPYCFI